MKKSRIVMVIAALLLFTPFFFPIWRIVLEAPQYPTPLGLDIHINKIVDMNPNDLKNINLMNHYIGMKDLPVELPELEIMPIIIIVMGVAGVLLAAKGESKWYLTWFVVMAFLGCLGMYDFYLWQYDYGHTLDPRAIIKFTNEDGTPMAYQPPLLGTKKILNFTIHSYPQLGGYLVGLGAALSFVAACVGWKEENQ